MEICKKSLKLAEDFVYIILKEGIEQKASDIHLTVGAPPAFRKNGRLYSFINGLKWKRFYG